MTDPAALRAYLAARKSRDDAFLAEAAALEAGADAAWHEAFSAFLEARARFAEVAAACLPRELADLRYFWSDVGSPGDRIGKEPHEALLVIEDAYIWLPLLALELGTDQETAEVAWAIGQRPAGY